MSKNKVFKEGDKVFAKVKGYPAWPAKVTKKTDKKYEVHFYGTNETGTIKPEDICLYVENKSTILKKPINRKFYPEAVEEIEEELKNEGVEISELNNSISNGEVKSNKRKRSKSPGLQDEPAEAEIESENGATEENDNVETPTKSNKKKRGPKYARKSINAVNTLDKFLVKQNDAEPMEPQVTAQELVDIDFISAEYLRHIIDFATKVRNKEEHYKKKVLKDVEKPSNQVLVVKLPSGTFAGIKYNPPEADNEFDQAVNEEKAAKTTLELLEKLQDGSMNPEDDPTNIISNINKNEQEVRDVTIAKISDRKKAKLKWLAVESKMVGLDTKIRMALNMQKAEPEKALEHLKAMMELPIEPLMLKKHPQLPETIKRLRKYIGNLKEWKLPTEEEQKFLAEAEEIRKFAGVVYDKFQKLFEVPESEPFWDYFNKKVEEFKENSKDFSDVEVFGLCAEPDTRQAFMDLWLDEIPVGKDVLTPEKENISQVANGTAHIEKNLSPAS